MADKFKRSTAQERVPLNFKENALSFAAGKPLENSINTVAHASQTSDQLRSLRSNHLGLIL